jgi:hypothetical protein
MEANSYYAVAVQLILFFGLVVLILLPGLFLRQIAKKKNKSGWLYFAAGIGVSVFGIALARLAMEALRLLNESPPNVLYLGVIYFVLAILFICTGYAVLRQRLMNSQ